MSRPILGAINIIGTVLFLLVLFLPRMSQAKALYTEAEVMRTLNLQMRNIATYCREDSEVGIRYYVYNEKYEKVWRTDVFICIPRTTPSIEL